MSSLDDAADMPIRVAIGLIEREGGYLIRQRPPGSIMAGIWEFPGGKCEEDEHEAAAVRRECLEETGIEVEVLRLRSSIEHRYQHGHVRLTYFDCVPSDAEVEPTAESGFRWVPAGRLKEYRFPEANERVIQELTNS